MIKPDKYMWVLDDEKTRNKTYSFLELLIQDGVINGSLLIEGNHIYLSVNH